MPQLGTEEQTLYERVARIETLLEEVAQHLYGRPRQPQHVEFFTAEDMLAYARYREEIIPTGDRPVDPKLWRDLRAVSPGIKARVLGGGGGVMTSSPMPPRQQSAIREAYVPLLPARSDPIAMAAQDLREQGFITAYELDKAKSSRMALVKLVIQHAPQIVDEGLRTVIQGVYADDPYRGGLNSEVDQIAAAIAQLNDPYSEHLTPDLRQVEAEWWVDWEHVMAVAQHPDPPFLPFRDRAVALMQFALRRDEPTDDQIAAHEAEGELAARDAHDAEVASRELREFEQAHEGELPPEAYVDQIPDATMEDLVPDDGINEEPIF